MAKASKDDISKHPTKGFRLTVGKKADGKPRLFWLGHDREIAGHHCNYLRAQYLAMKQESRDVWTDGDIANVNRWVGYHKRDVQKRWADFHGGMQALQAEKAELLERIAEHQQQRAPIAPPPSDETSDATVAKPPQMFHALLDSYLKWTDAKADRSASGKMRAGSLVASLKRAHGDTSVTQMDRLWLDSLVQHWKNRPPHAFTGKQLSSYTIKTVLQFLSQFFAWMSDNEEVTGFVEPKKMAKLFKYRAEEITEIDQLTIDEIKMLYAAATDQQRLFLLTGIMCGMTQGELSATTRDEFDFEKCIWTHRRHKTKVMGSHWLCPELVTLLKDRIKITPNNPGNLAFVTKSGANLVTYSKTGKVSDSVLQNWNDLLSNVDFGDRRRPTFKMCRKFLAQWMFEKHGDQMAQTAIQHKSQSVLVKHYAQKRNFDPLHEAQRELYAELKAAGVFVKKRTVSKDKSAA